MTPNEVDKAIEVIRTYCKEAECLKCEYNSSTGCEFVKKVPCLWKTLEETENEVEPND